MTSVIAGVSSAIGLETAKQLAAAGMNVIGIDLAAKDGPLVKRRIREAGPKAEVRIVAADLSSLREVRRAAASLRAELPGGRLDRLILNATAVPDRYIGTEDGYELQFAVNYLSAFLLTRELFPSLARPAEARIITVCSASHRKTEMDWRDPMFRRRYRPLQAFRQSKLALVLFTLELNRRVACRVPVRAIGVELDPGPVHPAVGERARRGGRPGMLSNRRDRGLSAADAASAIVRLAVEPPWAVPGAYWRLGRPVEPSPYARSAGAACRLWRLSEDLCGTHFL